MAVMHYKRVAMMLIAPFTTKHAAPSKWRPGMDVGLPLWLPTPEKIWNHRDLVPTHPQQSLRDKAAFS